MPRPGGVGSLKVKFLKESMKLNWNFQRGGGEGLNPKTFHVRVIDIFWNNTLN